MRALLPLVALLLGATAPDQARPVPDSISPQARAMLQAMAEHGGGPPPAIPRTPAEWDARNQTMQAFVAQFDKPVLEALRPRVTELTLGGVPTLRIEPSAGARAAPVLLYVHGGAFTLFSARSTVAGAAQMATASGLAVYSIDYTLAPRGDWRTVTDQVVAAYRALLAQGVKPARIGIFGESAGGNIILASVLKLRDQGVPMPAALLAMSPATDLTGAGDTRATLSAADPVLTPGDRDAGPDAYAPVADRRNPYVSPVYGDYRRGFPPTLIQVGTREWLLSDAVREYQAIDAAGGDVTLDVYEGMPHVFQNVLHGTLEAQRAYAKAAAFWARHLAK